MNILVIDSHGGGIGKQLIPEIKIKFPDIEITAVGTNNAATSAMLKAGADHAATGENPVVVACRKADIIIGPIGIVIADSMYGEITRKMAVAVGSSSAKRILIPMNKCDNIVIGVQDLSVKSMIDHTIEAIETIIK